MADSLVRFDRHGDGLPRYTLYNYQQNSQATGWDYKVDSLLQYRMTPQIRHSLASGAQSCCSCILLV